MIYNANITLQDPSGRVLLQRFGPFTNALCKEMLEASLEGDNLLYDLTEFAEPHTSNGKRVPPETAQTDRQLRSFNRLHLGAWHDQATKRLG